MRIQTFLLSTILFIGSITSLAQTGPIYSSNVVGYVVTTLRPGLNLISNPLLATNNTLATLFTGLPNGTQVYKFNGATFSTYGYINSALGWSPSTASVETTLPGEGVFLRNPLSTETNVFFIGEVRQGTITINIPVGLSIISNPVPIPGAPPNLPVGSGDQIYKWNGTGYVTYGRTPFGWSPSEPTVAIGEAFFIRRTAPRSPWVIDFTVN